MFLDAQGVPEDIDREMHAVQEKMRAQVGGSLCTAVETGGVLDRAQRKCRLGEFTAWLKEHFVGTPRKAEGYMALWRQYGGPDRVPKMSLRAALDALTKHAKQPPTTYVHQRPCSAVVTAGIEATRRARKSLDRLIRAMRRDGMTPQHYAMKRLRRAAADIAAACEYFLAQEATQRAGEQASARRGERVSG